MTWQVMGLRRKVQRELMETGLPDDLRAEFHRLSAWAQTLPDKFGDHVRVRLVDVASIEGFFKSLLQRVARYPAFSVDGARYAGLDFARVDSLIVEALRRKEGARAAG